MTKPVRFLKKCDLRTNIFPTISNSSEIRCRVARLMQAALETNSPLSFAPFQDISSQYAHSIIMLMNNRVIYLARFLEWAVQGRMS
ncbi:MAG: hypothetical protein HOH33_09360 [Verrucomicrobia bacterium]|jgi:hypothetical protein|nr:hypothetical protein [Verrucomicrobiota bacterium]